MAAEEGGEGRGRRQGAGAGGGAAFWLFFINKGILII